MAQQARLDPEEKEKRDAMDWVNKTMDEIRVKIDLLEASISSKAKKRGLSVRLFFPLVLGVKKERERERERSRERERQREREADRQTRGRGLRGLGWTVGLLVCMSLCCP